MTKDDYDYWYNKWSSTHYDFDTPNVVAVGAPALCMCKDRLKTECPGEWEPGCDLGNNPKFVKAYVPRTPQPAGPEDMAVYAAIAANYKAAPDPANSYARSLAVALHASHYPEVTQWRPLDDTMGLLTQIDNMTCSLVRAEAAPTVVEPDMRHPKIQRLIGGNARRDIEIGLIEQLLEDPDCELTSMGMEYWGPMHDKLREKLLAAHPPRTPLTDEQIDDCLPLGMALHSTLVRPDEIRKFARAVIAASGGPRNE
jgi:hypothetical protein